MAVGTAGRAIEIPTPASESTSSHSAILKSVEARSAIQANPTAWRLRPTTISGRRPIRSERAPASGANENRCHRPGEQANAGRERRVAEPELEVLGDHEGAAEDRSAHQEGARVSGREPPVAQEPQRQHRLGRAGFPPKESGDHSNAGHEAADDLRATPTEFVRAHESPDEADDAGGNE